MFTLPLVVLVSLMMQPRLQFALARDGLIPKMFSEVDSNGDPRKGALFAGVLMTVFATFVPFADLDDFICAGILLAFTLTNCSLIIMRRKSPETDTNLLSKLLAGFNTSAFATCLLLSHGLHLFVGCIAAVIFGLLTIFSVITIQRKCPPTSVFGETSQRARDDENRRYFTTPLVPIIPCFGIFVNYVLVSRLSLFGIGLVLLYTACLALFYFLYGVKHSVARRAGWTTRQYSSVEIDDHIEMNNVVIPPII